MGIMTTITLIVCCVENGNAEEVLFFILRTVIWRLLFGSQDSIVSRSAELQLDVRQIVVRSPARTSNFCFV